MKEPDRWIEPDRLQGRIAVVRHQGIEERKQSVYRVQWRPAAAALPPENLTLLSDQAIEDAEVAACGLAFVTPQRVERRFFPPSPEHIEASREVPRGRSDLLGHARVVRLSGSPDQERSRVCDLADDDGARQPRAAARVVGRSELRTSYAHAR
jgi:hypothetical protein